jgi:hypothetical protein
MYDREQVTPFPGRALPPVAYPEVDRSQFIEGKGSLYGLKALAGVLQDAQAMEQEGAGRNNMLSRTAFRIGQLVAAGDVDGPYAEDFVERLAEAVCPDERQKATNTVKRGLISGRRYPRGSGK